MISSMVLKSKLCLLFSKQMFIRLPLKLYRKLSFFLQNWSRIDFNQPRSHLAMYRIQKSKKRKYGRQNWNLKKYWKFRRIGLELDVIKEEGDKEYLAEIEIDDDSLESSEYRNPNNVFVHKNSSTYFGLVKFPINFSPSELALKHLCRGRTLQQIFPRQIDAGQQPAPTNIIKDSSEISLPGPEAMETLTALNLKHSTQSHFFEKKDTPIISNVPSKLLKRLAKYKNVIKNKKLKYERKINNNKTRSSSRRGISNSNICSKCHKICKNNQKSCCGLNVYVKRNNQNAIQFEPPQEIRPENVAVKNIINEKEDFIYKNHTQKALKIEANGNTKIKLNTTDKTISIGELHQQRSSLQESNCTKLTSAPLIEVESPLNLNSNIVSTNPDLQMLTIEKEEDKPMVNAFDNVNTKNQESLSIGQLGFIGSSFKILRKSFENNLDTTNLIKERNFIEENSFVEVGKESRKIELEEILNKSNNITMVYENSERSVDSLNLERTNIQQSVEDYTFSCKLSECNNFINTHIFVTDEEQVKLEASVYCDKHESMNIDYDIRKQKSNIDQLHEDVIKCHRTAGDGQADELNCIDQMSADQELIENGSNNKIHLPQDHSTQSNLHPKEIINHHKLRKRQKSFSTPKIITRIATSSIESQTTLLPSVNYSMNMFGVVHRMFGCSTNSVCRFEQQTGLDNETKFNSGLFGTCGVGNGYVEHRVTTGNMVQLDHKSLWTEFVSDMIVNSRVRKVQI